MSNLITAEILVYVGFIIVDSKRLRLTKSIAKQFMRLDETEETRYHSGFENLIPKALLKIRAENLFKDRTGWLILVETDNGPAWDVPHPTFDVLEDIPTVIL